MANAAPALQLPRSRQVHFLRFVFGGSVSRGQAPRACTRRSPETSLRERPFLHGIARDLGDGGWENRANGELGVVSFLKGNTGEATTLVRGAVPMR